MAFNEEGNIGRLLQLISAEKLTRGNLVEFLVVASGCTDRTEEIVRGYMAKDRRIRILTQKRREGKASAINLFLSEAMGDIMILESADTLPEQGALDRLIAPFVDPNVGMTGAHPIPMNGKNTFIGFAVHLMWKLHHEIALMSPKLGELVAFRSFVREIPVDTAVDEAAIEAIVRTRGYELCYVSDSIVINKGPQNIRDFIKQRRRIAAGHTSLLLKHKYKVSTSNPFIIISILLREHKWKFKNTIWTIGTIGLETWSRMLGYYDVHISRKIPVIWEIAGSTKQLD